MSDLPVDPDPHAECPGCGRDFGPLAALLIPPGSYAVANVAGCCCGWQGGVTELATVSEAES